MIPVVEEELEVGKRQVDLGAVRVVSRMVETPVNESVTLREEHANIERRPVDRPGAVDHLALVVDEEQVADAHVPEAEAERVDPEVVGELRVANGDVAGDALSEAQAAEDPQRTGQLVLAVLTLVLDGLERRDVEVRLLRCQRDPVDRRYGWCRYRC